MVAIRHLFFDDGDVMNDNALRGPQWHRLIGEFFVPRLGGTFEAWASANTAVISDVDGRYWERASQAGTSADLWRAYKIDWLRSMAACVGVDVPEDDKECHDLSHAAMPYITPRIRAAYPGAVEAIEQLAREYNLYTASNEHSEDLQAYLEGMGVAQLFRGFYGCDLIGASKPAAMYYQRMFEHAGVDATESLVVDDKPECLAAAATLGARVISVRVDGVAPEGLPWIRTLAELPERLKGGLLE
jgi:HAD superfamily hydrolase (TIGR01509 family)